MIKVMKFRAEAQTMLIALQLVLTMAVAQARVLDTCGCVNAAWENDIPTAACTDAVADACLPGTDAYRALPQASNMWNTCRLQGYVQTQGCNCRRGHHLNDKLALHRAACFLSVRGGGRGGIFP